MTENMIKKIGFSFLVLGLLIANISTATAQVFGSGNATGDTKTRVTSAIENAKNTLKDKWATEKGIDPNKIDLGLHVDLFGKDLFAWKYTYTNPDGSTGEVWVNSDLKATDGIMEGCIPIPIKLDQLKKCIFCPLFKVLYDAAQAMAVASFATLAKAFKALLLLGFALYIAYITLQQVSAFTKQDAPTYITNALTMALKVFFAYLLLVNGPEIYRLGLEPLLSAGIEMGSEFMKHQDAGASVNVSDCGGAVSNTNTTFYSQALYSKVDCFLKKVTQEIAVSQSIGSSLMCVSRHKASHWYGMWDLTMFATGAIMWAVAWLICLAFAFYLIDTIIKLGIIGAVMPFLIAAWPFKLTQKYALTGWQMFLNAFFTFVFLGLVISVNVELSAQAATGGNGSTADIITMMNGNDIEGLLEVMNIGLSGLIFMLVCCFFGFKLTGEAAKLASEMSGAQSSSVGSAIGAAAAGVAKNKIAKPAANAAVGAVKGGAKFAGAALPSIGAFTDKVQNTGSLGNDARLLGERVSTAPARAAAKINSWLTPAGRKMQAAQSGGAQNGDDNKALPDNDEQQSIAGIPENNQISSNQERQNTGGATTPNQQAEGRDNQQSENYERGSAPVQTPSGGYESTGGAAEAEAKQAQEAAPRDEDNDNVAQEAANGVISSAKSELESAAQNAADSVTIGAGKEQDKENREQEQRMRASAAAVGGNKPKGAEPMVGKADDGVATASNEEVNQAKHDLQQGKQLPPETVASIVKAQNLSSKEIRGEVKRTLENAAANGVERKDIAAVSYLLAEVNGEHVAEKKNPSTVHEYQKNIDSETLRRASEQLRAAQAKEQQKQEHATTPNPEQPRNDGKQPGSEAQSSGGGQGTNRDNWKPTGSVNEAHKSGGDKRDKGGKDSSLEKDLESARGEAQSLNALIAERTRKIEELQKLLSRQGDAATEIEIRKLREEIARLQKLGK